MSEPITGVAAKAHIEGVFGSTGSGKSTYVKTQLRKARPARLLVYDPDDEYAGPFGRRVTRLGDVIEGILAAAGGGFKLVFVPAADRTTAVKQFDALCRIAFAAERLTLVVDELASVTKASYAPPGWSMCTSRGRKKGLTIYGMSQRPAAVDKMFFGNCTQVRSGRLIYEPDRKVLGAVLDIHPDDLKSLPDLGYVQRDMLTGNLTRSK